MVIRVSDKKKNYSKVTKLLVKPLFFCDLKHGSPYNQLLINMIEIKVNKYKIITGMNLPMVLQAVIKMHGSTDFDDIVKISSEAGAEGITVYEPK